MANKDFKVKNGLDIQTPLPVSMGGTGQTSTTNTLNSLLPSQDGNSNKVLSTDGTNTTWAAQAVAYQRGGTASRPASPTAGDLYYNTDTNIFEQYTSLGWFAIAVAPGAPTGVTATNQPSGRAFNNGQMSVAFTPNTSAGAPSSFVVTPSPSTSPSTFTATSSPITVTNLASSTQYTYTVTASSAYGTSAASSASTAVTATTVPQAPTINSVTPGDSNASIAFTANATGGSAITGYTVTASPGGATTSGSSSPITFSGLTNGTSYTFTITATNTNGTSISSSSSDSTTIGVQNYFGTGADGAVTISSNTALTVPNKVGSYDGDMVVKNYSSLTINSGSTLTTDQPCRGMLIYVTGNCTINGTLSMTGRGAYANPTISGASDSNAVSSSGLQIPFKTVSGTQSLTASESLFNGCGTAARSAIANHTSLSSNGTVLVLSRQGALGGGGGAGGNYHHMGSNGSNGSTGQTGGGGGGRGGYADNTGSGGSGGGGSYGSCFAGGSGGGSGNYPGQSGGAATAWAGQGGSGGGGGNYPGAGGIGNPLGNTVGNTTWGSYVPAQGTGGLIILIVGGNLTIGASGSIVAKGGDSPKPTEVAAAGGHSACSNSGGSGGGNIVIAYKGSYANSGNISAAGGAQSHAQDDRSGSGPVDGGGGGNGSIQTIAVL
jgi:hypothetical protein